MPILLGRKRTPQEFANFVFDMAQKAKGGFRPFGGIVEQAARAAGLIKDSTVTPLRAKWRKPPQHQTTPLEHMHSHARRRLLAMREAAE